MMEKQTAGEIQAELSTQHTSHGSNPVPNPSLPPPSSIPAGQPAMPSPQQCQGAPSHLEQPAFILNLMQQSVFLHPPKAPASLWESIPPLIRDKLLLYCLRSLGSICFLFRPENILFPTLFFFHKFLMLACLAKYRELCLPQGTMKNWITQAEHSFYCAPYNGDIHQHNLSQACLADFVRSVNE